MTRRSLPVILLLAACGSRQTPASSEPEGPPLLDLGCTLHEGQTEDEAAHGPTPLHALLSVTSTRQRAAARAQLLPDLADRNCSGEHEQGCREHFAQTIARAEAAAAGPDRWPLRFYLSLGPPEPEPYVDCEAESSGRPSGSIPCEGDDAILTLDGDSLRLAEGERSADFSITPADPVERGLALAMDRRAGSSETEHLSWVLDLADASAEQLGMTPEGLRSTLVAEGIDPAGVCFEDIAEARRDVQSLLGSVPSMGPEDRQELLRSVLMRALLKP